MKKYRYIFLLLAYAALWVVCRSTVEYTVTFDPNGGELVEGELVQSVRIGKAAQAPVLDNGRYELHWDQSFDKIREETYVTARWEKVPLSKDGIHAYARECIVHVVGIDPKGEESVSAGFFLNDSGRVAASFSAVAGAESLSIELSDGSRCEVKTVSGYHRPWDLVLLETGLNNTPCLELAAEYREGQPVYSWTRSLKSLRSGEILSGETAVGTMDCVETTLQSIGGGYPVVDVYGDVVAVHHALDDYKTFAVAAKQLPEIMPDQEKTPEEFRAWYNTERSRSYELRDGDGYRPAMIRTYQMVVGTECSHSVYKGARYEGYYLRFDSYIYEYFEPEFRLYLDYLEHSGYLLSEKETQGYTLIYRYYNELDRVEITLAVNEEKSELEIRVTQPENQ